GGMKGITLVQAFQYWAKMFAISAPIFVLMAVYGHYGKHLAAQGSDGGPVGMVVRQPLPPKAPGDELWISPFGPLTTKAAKAAAAALTNRVDLTGTLPLREGLSPKARLTATIGETVSRRILLMYGELTGRALTSSGWKTQLDAFKA